MTIAANTLALYKFENNLLDSSGNGFTLTNAGAGGGTFATTPTPPVGSYSIGAFVANKYQIGPAGLTAALSGLSNFTVEAWVYQSSTGTSGVIYRHNATTVSTGYIELRTDASALPIVYFQCYNGSAWISALTQGQPLNNWYHVAGSFSSGVIKLFMNGTLVSTNTVAAQLTVFGTINALLIGSDASSYWRGNVDELRISNVSRTILPTLDIPDNLTAGTPTTTSVPLTWNDTTGATYYYLYSNTSNSTVGATLRGVVAQGAGAGTVYGLSPSTQYWFFLKAQNHLGGLNAFTSSVTATTASLTPAPNAPTGLTVGTPTATTLPITWTDPAAGAYIFAYVGTSPNPTTLWDVAAYGAQAMTLTGLAAFTPYYIRLKTLGTDGQLSAYTADVTGTTTTSALPTAATSLTATATSRTTARLAWLDGLNWETGIIYRHTLNAPSSALAVGYVSAAVQTFTDTGLLPGTAYFWWVAGVNASGLGDKSASATATTESVNSQSLVPSVTEKHLAYDLLKHLVLSILDSTGAANFVDGIADAANPQAGKLHLFPHYLEDEPDDAGVVRTEDGAPNPESPVRTAKVTLALRCARATAGGTAFSGQERAMEAGNSIREWLMASGVIRTYETLPSGRVVLVFKEPRVTPQGEDGSGRFLAEVTFEILYRDINIP